MTRIIDENFEGTGYEESWSETVTAGNTLDEDAAIPGTPPPGAGSQCLKAIFTAGAVDAFASQVKSNQNINYIRGYLYLSEEGLNNTQVIAGLRLYDSTSALASDIIIGQNSGVLQMAYRKYTSGAFNTSAWVNISLNTLYRVEYQYDLTNLLWEWKIDGVSQSNGTLAAATRIPDRMRIGGAHNGAAQSTLYTDLVVWDNAGWVGAESAGGNPWYAYAQM